MNAWLLTIFLVYSPGPGICVYDLSGRSYTYSIQPDQQCPKQLTIDLRTMRVVQ